MKWDHTGEVDKFVIYWNTEDGMEYNMRTTKHMYKIEDLTPATEYYVSVAAVFGSDISERSIYKYTVIIGNISFKIHTCSELACVGHV